MEMPIKAIEVIYNEMFGNELKNLQKQAAEESKRGKYGQYKIDSKVIEASMSAHKAGFIEGFNKGIVITVQAMSRKE